jgi:two-component system, response regulator
MVRLRRLWVQPTELPDNPKAKLFLEVLERVKSDDRTRTIPVVVLSSSQEEQEITRSYDLGVNSYTVKPVEFDKFFQVVEELGLYWLTLNQVPK